MQKQALKRRYESKALTFKNRSGSKCLSKFLKLADTWSS